MTSTIQSVNIATGSCHAHAYVLIKLVFLFQYIVMLYTAPHLGAWSVVIFYFIMNYFAQPAKQEEKWK